MEVLKVNKSVRIRGYNDSSIIVTQTKSGVKIETFVRGGKTYFHLSKTKAEELGKVLLQVSKNEDPEG